MSNTQTNQPDHGGLSPAQLLGGAGVLSLVGALVAFIVARVHEAQAAKDYATGRFTASLSHSLSDGPALGPWNAPGGNYALTMGLVVIGVVLITWALLVRRRV